jgi:hypothetical protein
MTLDHVRELSAGPHAIGEGISRTILTGVAGEIKEPSIYDGIGPWRGDMYFEFILHHGLEIGTFVDKHIVPTSMCFAKKQHAALI